MNSFTKRLLLLQHYYEFLGNIQKKRVNLNEGNNSKIKTEKEINEFVLVERRREIELVLEKKGFSGIVSTSMCHNRNTKLTTINFEKVAGVVLEKEAFVIIRKKLNRTQKQLAELLGVSLKAIHSYEQGWRKIPLHIERQLWFLIYQKKKKKGDKNVPCWKRKSCEMKKECPAWEFQCGDMCWFVCGTKCDCTKDIDVRDKMVICRKCKILKTLLK